MEGCLQPDCLPSALSSAIFCAIDLSGLSQEHICYAHHLSYILMYRSEYVYIVAKQISRSASSL